MAVKKTSLYTPHCEPDEFPIGVNQNPSPATYCCFAPLIHIVTAAFLVGILQGPQHFQVTLGDYPGEACW